MNRVKISEPELAYRMHSFGSFCLNIHDFFKTSSPNHHIPPVCCQIEIYGQKVTD